MTGGIPYYLEQVPRIINFIQAINKTFFRKGTIFLDEFSEIINLDFNKCSHRHIKKILQSLGQDGKTMVNISRSTRIPESTTNEIVNKLLDYSIVFEKSPLNKAPKKNKSGNKYYMRDFFLNFYFQIIEPMRRKIVTNTKSNLFVEHCISSRQGYYIVNFSGKAFELLIESVIDNRSSTSRKEKLFNQLELDVSSYNWGHYWEEGKTQIDLIVESQIDRESRIIEAKWISQEADLSTNHLNSLEEKQYLPPRGYRLSLYLFLSQKASKNYKALATKKGIKILSLKDLF